MSYLGLGIAQGAQRAGEDLRNREMREEQLKTAKAQRQLAEQQLADNQAAAPAKKSQAELMAYQASRQLIQMQTYDAINRYDSEGDTRHLNMFLDQMRQNPIGSKIYGNMTRFDRLDSVQMTPEVEGILKKAGYTDPQDAIREGNPNMVLGTGPDGKYTLVDLGKFKAMSGYTKYAGQEKLAEEEKRARINQMLRGGVGFAKIQQLEDLSAKIRSENPGMSTAEAYQRANSILNAGGGSADERFITRIMQEENLSALDAATKYYGAKRAGAGQTNESQFIEDYMAQNPGASRVEASEAYANRTKTSTQKVQTDVNAIKTELKDSGFFDKDMAKLSPVERADIHEKVAQLEDLRGLKLSTEDKRLARQFRDLTMLGKQAGEKLTDAETGIIDTMLNSVNAYLTDEVGGKEATSAYESFRNIYRNALYGASLTKSEIESFNKAMGTLGQQTKPVLAQLKTQMNSIKHQLESVRDTNDPYIAHYYFGSGIDDIDRVVQSLEQRLDVFNKEFNKKARVLTTSDVIKQQSNVPATPPGTQPKRSLEDIFGGGN